MGNALTAWLAEHFEEVSPMAFYRGIFPAGALEKAGEYVTGKYTGIIVAVTSEIKPDGKKKVCRYSITDDLEAVKTAVSSNDFCLCSPLSYAGKRRTAENARMLYAIAVDVDKINTLEDGYPIGLANLWERHINGLKRVPKPTYIVSSGSGLHLYYVLVKPIPLYRDIAQELQEYKRELTRLIWNDTIVAIKNPYEIQQEGIYQGFRMPGTITKNGDRAKAFLIGPRVTMEYLNSFAQEPNKARKAAKVARKRERVPIDAAAEKWPEWYERRVVKKEKPGVWHVNRAVYDWWKERIKTGATVGHRYYCLMILAMYARKCSYYDEKHNPNPVTREELEKDSFGMIDRMEAMTISPNNHFGADDVLDALEAFEDRWTRYPRTAIEYKSAIVIPANPRKGQKQVDHLEEARAIRDIRARRRGEKWDAHAHGGRKSAALDVWKWRQENPNGKKADCIRETGLSKPTVYKHWDAVLTKRD